MPVKISFIKPGGLGSIHAIGIGDCRVCETITVPGSTTASLQAGEIIHMVSTETGAVVAAHGSTPDAAATATTGATTAGYGIPTGVSVVVAARVGDKVNVKAFV